MVATPDVSVDISAAEGTKVSLGLFGHKRDTDEAQRDTLLRQLDIESGARASARLGLHQATSACTSNKQAEIRLGFEDLDDATTTNAIRAQDDVRAQQVEQLQAVSIEDFDAAGSEHSAELEDTETAHANRARALIADHIAAQTTLTDFEDKHKAADRPTPLSFMPVIGRTVVSTAIETIVSTVLFSPELGPYTAAGFGAGASITLALAGGLGGVGWQWLNRQRYLSGSTFLGLGLAGFAGASVIFAHYRKALIDGKDDLAAATEQSIRAHLLGPVFDAPVLIFTAITIGTCVWVATKAGETFAWRDLARLRKAVVDAARKAAACLDAAITECGRSLSRVSSARSKLLEQAVSTAAKGRKLKDKAMRIGDAARKSKRFIARSYLAAEGRYRRIVSKELRDDGLVPSFPDPIEELEVAALPATAAVDLNAVELEERPGRWKALMAGWVAADTEKTNQAQTRITLHHRQIDRDLRTTRRPPLHAVV